MKAFYFPHDENAANDERVLQLRAQFGNAEAYGMWWMLLEHLVRNKGYLMGDSIGVLSISYGLEHKKVAQFVELCVTVGLLKKDKRGLFNARLMEHIDLMEKKIEGGKEGAKRRWGSQNKAIRSPISSPNGSPNAEDRIGEERRGYDIKKPTKKTTENAPPQSKREEAERQQKSDEDTEKEFFALALSEQWCEHTYAESKQKQLHETRTDNRNEIFRKMRVCLNAAKSSGESTRKLAKKMYGEIVGMIQDRALDDKTLDGKALAKRRKFAQQEIGGQNAELEVGDVQVWDQ